MHQKTALSMLALFLFMIISIFLGTVIGFKHVHHIANNMNGYEINAAIVNSNGITTQTNVIRNVSQIDFHNVRKIFAVPKDKDFFARMFTKTANIREHLNIQINN
jgi:hypothetical protein